MEGLISLLYQEMTIPADISAARLVTNHRISYGPDGRGTEPREFKIEIADPAEQWSDELYSESVVVAGPAADRGWKTNTFDLAEYAGQTVRVQFSQYIPESYTGPGLLELDDVSLGVIRQEDAAGASAGAASGALANQDRTALVDEAIAAFGDRTTRVTWARDTDLARTRTDQAQRDEAIGFSMRTGQNLKYEQEPAARWRRPGRTHQPTHRAIDRLLSAWRG